GRPRLLPLRHGDGGGGGGRAEGQGRARAVRRPHHRPALGGYPRSRWAASASPISTVPSGKYSCQRRVTAAAVAGSPASSFGNEGFRRASTSTGASCTRWWRTTRVARA